MQNAICISTSNQGKSASFIPFAPQYSFDFNGANARFLSDNDVLNITEAFSTHVFINTASINNYGSIMCKDTTGGSARSWNLLYRGLGSGIIEAQLFLWNTDGTQNVLQTITLGAIPLSGWIGIGYSYTGDGAANGLKSYVSGVLNSQMTTGSTGVRNYTGSNSAIAVGEISNNGGLGFPFDGKIFQPVIKNGVVWDASDFLAIGGGAPIDLTSYAPDIYLMDDSAWNGSAWEWTNEGSVSTVFTSQNMLITDRTTDVP